MNIITQNKDIASVFAITAAILMIPLVAMQFTGEVDWDHTDFIVMSTLLTSTGLLIVFVSRKLKSAKYRAIVILALLVAFFLTWAHLAVGIVDTWPLAGS